MPLQMVYEPVGNRSLAQVIDYICRDHPGSYLIEPRHRYRIAHRYEGWAVTYRGRSRGLFVSLDRALGYFTDYKSVPPLSGWLLADLR